MQFGGAAVAGARLRHLLGMSERDHITIRVIPFAAGGFPGPGRRQESTHCGEGGSCVHIATTPQAVHTADSDGPGGAVLTTSRDGFRLLLLALKKESPFIARRHSA
ncbi:Scr1 family TA system antitoxin-like transcriptional regulator [Streptomyces caelestis]|uniref:DUF397 domain-containing protein n=1 Tax=Streptomyces caelestis TaxID=36816 RepID=UPI003648D357